MCILSIQTGQSDGYTARNLRINSRKKNHCGLFMVFWNMTQCSLVSGTNNQEELDIVWTVYRLAIYM